MPLNSDALQLLMTANALDEINQKSSTQAEGQNAFQYNSEIFKTPLTSPPFYILRQDPRQNGATRSKEEIAGDLQIRSSLFVNFITTSFEQRVAGDAVRLLKESEDGYTTAISDLGISSRNVCFPFKRTIVHYAMFFKWRCVIDFVCGNRMDDELTRPDIFGLTPLEYYFMNISANYEHYVKRQNDTESDSVTGIPVFQGYIYNFRTIYDASAKTIVPRYYETDFYLYNIARGFKLMRRIESIMQCIYYNQDADLVLIENSGDDLYSRPFIQLNEFQFYRTMHEVFHDLLTTQGNFKDCWLYGALSGVELSVKCWRSQIQLPNSAKRVLTRGASK